ncbi:pitrilysin [Orbus wheelerorum]|uniref:pitrilysin n=1 Tax=Orbus wheelerorum TaxID=3074111 RepID=UPI00370D06DA
MKKYYLFFSLYLGILSLLIQPSYAIDLSPSYTTLTNNINKNTRDDRQYRIIELSNKMKVLLISDHNAAKSLASLALPIGSLYDPKTQQGLAHYTEHMVLMGSEKYPEPDNFSTFLSLHAGSYNASTAANRTAFYFEVENNAFLPALDRLADAIAKPLFNPVYANKERNAVDAELTAARSNDGFRIQQVNAETINQQHPASMFFGGNLQTLSDKEGSNLHDELIKFHHHYYDASMMVGVIYSNQSLDKLADLAVQTFGKIKDKNTKVDPITVPATTAENLGKMIYMQPAQPKKELYLQFPIENNIAQFADKSDEYIAYMISNRSQNTLFDQLHKQGLIESIGANAEPLRYGNSGVFSIYVSLTDQGLDEKEQVIASIFNYLQLLEQKGIDSKYYDELAKVLTLEFKYSDITRDMSYVEQLADQMLFYPMEHVLDADYIATNFNRSTINNRLKSLIPDNARIWVIAPEQQTNKVAYFVNAPYQVEDLDKKKIRNFMMLDKNNHFDLPVLNPYLVDDFSLVKQNDNTTKNENAFCNTGNNIHFSSEYFKDEPKAAIALSLRNNFALDNAENQVMFYLLDYLANRELAKLRFQADVAGVSFSTGTDSGLFISLSGFNQHLDNMLLDILATYRHMVIDEKNLQLAKSWYLEKLAAADHANSVSLAMQSVGALSVNPYFDREIRRVIIPKITVEKLQQYRDQLLYDSVPYMISIGNLDDESSAKTYYNIKQSLDEKAHYNIQPPMMVNQTLDALITKHAVSSDNALLMGFVPKSYDKITSRVSSDLLTKIISPWFYDQLRSNEQLGYSVFSLPIDIGDTSGIGFLIQSNQYDPAYINDRYKAFYPVILNKLNALTENEFKQYKQSVLDEQLTPPQTLDEEFANYLTDYQQSLFNFDSKQQRIERLKEMSKKELIDFYRSAVIEANGLVVASQVLGNQPDKIIKSVTGLTEYQGTADLQKKLLGN